MPEVDLAMSATKKAAEGCCMNDQWRGHACEYHQGYEDGYDAALRAAESLRVVITTQDEHLAAIMSRLDALDRKIPQPLPTRRCHNCGDYYKGPHNCRNGGT